MDFFNSPITHLKLNAQLCSIYKLNQKTGYIATFQHNNQLISAYVNETKAEDLKNQCKQWFELFLSYAETTQKYLLQESKLIA